MPGLLYIKTFGCQMNEYDSGKMRDVLEAAHGMTAHGQSGGSGRVAGQYLLRARKSAGESVFPAGRMAAVQTAAPACRHRRRRLRREPGGRGHHRAGAVRRSGVRAANPASAAGHARWFERIRPAANRHQFSGNREIRPACPRRARPVRPRSSRSWKAAASTAAFASCPTLAARKSAARSSRCLRRCERLADQGVREITLLGQNVNAYAGPMADGTAADLATLIHFVAAVDGCRAHPLYDFASARFQRQPDRGVCERAASSTISCISPCKAGRIVFWPR